MVSIGARKARCLASNYLRTSGVKIVVRFISRQAVLTGTLLYSSPLDK